MADEPQQFRFDPDDLAAICAAVRPAPPSPAKDLKIQRLSSKKSEDWLSWKVSYLEICEIKGWNDAQKVQALRGAMAGDAALAVQGIRTAAGVNNIPPALTAEEALAAFEAKFVTGANTVAAQRLFRDSKQKEKGESITAWHTRVSQLFHRGYPNAIINTSHELIEQFIRGLKLQKVQEAAWDAHVDTMQAAHDAAVGKMATLIAMSGTGKSGALADEGINALDDDDGNNDSFTTVSAIKGRCYNCNEFGHMRRECPKPYRPPARRGGGGNFGGRGRTSQGRGRGGGRRGKGYGGRGRTGARRGVSRRSGQAQINAIQEELDAFKISAEEYREEEEDDEEGSEN